MLKVEKITVGLLAENTYLVYNQEGLALIIDPGAEGKKIMNRVEELNLTPQTILLTHTHHDHVGAVEEIRSHYGIQVYVHEIEADTLLVSATNPQVKNRPADVLWNESDMGKIYSVGDFEFRMAFIPGHSPGHVVFIFDEDEFVISGDTIFKGSIGRTDLAGGSYSDLMFGIKENLLTLADRFILYPGHGENTTIGQEKENNPFLQDFI